MGSQWGAKKLELMKASCPAGFCLQLAGGQPSVVVVRGRGRGTSIPGYKDILWQLGLRLSRSLVSSLPCERVACFPLPLFLPSPNNTQLLLSFITVVVAQLRSEDLQALW